MAEESKLEDRLWENIKSEENSVEILRKNEPSLKDPGQTISGIPIYIPLKSQKEKGERGDRKK